MFKFSNKWYISLPLDLRNILEEKIAGYRVQSKAVQQPEELLVDEFREAVKKEDAEV